MASEIILYAVGVLLFVVAPISLIYNGVRGIEMRPTCPYCLKCHEPMSPAMQLVGGILWGPCVWGLLLWVWLSGNWNTVV